MPPARLEKAPAKINLTLRVLGRRLDGYHDIESLVVFARIGDDLSFTPGRDLGLDVRGPTGEAAGSINGNLVLKAAKVLAERVAGLTVGHFVLFKRLPVAAGLGGGSSDAAAALRLLARANRLSRHDPRLLQAARATGADVPVCLDPRPRLMRGIGDVLSDPLRLAVLPAVLANPRIALATRDVFAALQSLDSVPNSESAREAPCAEFLHSQGRAELIAGLAQDRNDLEPPAITLAPVIAEVLAALRALSGCRLARMSGSGATCFALFDTANAATMAARTLRAQFPAWWIRATTLR